MAQIQMVTPSISGSYLTEAARSLMSDGEWKRALNFLTSTLGGTSEAPGISVEQAISVLEGKMRLTGSDDNIGMQAESPEVTAEVDQLYREVYEQNGYLKLDGKMFVAYAIVDNLGPDDGIPQIELHRGRQRTSMCGHWYEEIMRVERACCYPAVFGYADVEARALNYAASPQFDRAFVLNGAEGNRVAVLFESIDTGSTPFWRSTECTSPKEAFAPVMSTLTTAGYCQMKGYDIEEVLAEQLEQSLKARKISPEVKAQDNAALKKRDDEDAAKHARFMQDCIDIRQAVIDFADNDTEFGWETFEWTNPAGGPKVTLRAPKRALHCYALSATQSRNMMPDYKPFSYSGMKMADDNPFHSDVWLGCGFGIDESAYDRNNPIYRAFSALQFKVQRELLNYEAHVLARGPEVTGKVVFCDDLDITASSILVVPHAGEEFHVQAMKAGAVICAIGGKLAHLAIVCREQAKPVMRIDDAMSRFRRGQVVTVKAAEGLVVGSRQYLSATGAF